MIREKKIVFRCDGSAELGWGHVVRCANLAHWLKGKYKVYFVIHQNEEVVEYLKERNLPVFEISEKGLDEKILERELHTVLGVEPHLVINDICDTQTEYMQTLKEKNIKMVNIDDTTNNVKFAQALIDANRKEKEGKCFGPNYIVLDAVYAKLAKKKRAIHKKAKTIVISFGGSDPENLTDKTLRSLDDRLSHDVERVVVLGPSYQHRDDIKKWEEKGNVVFLEGVEFLGDVLLHADVAIVGGGITMCESLCLGTPTIVVAENKAQAKNARKMEKRSCVYCLGEGKKISDKKIMRKVASLMDDFNDRQKLSDKGKEIVDGRGLFRVLEQIELCT